MLRLTTGKKTGYEHTPTLVQRCRVAPGGCPQARAHLGTPPRRGAQRGRPLLTGEVRERRDLSGADQDSAVEEAQELPRRLYLPAEAGMLRGLGRGRRARGSRQQHGARRGRALGVWGRRTASHGGASCGQRLSGPCHLPARAGTGSPAEGRGRRPGAGRGAPGRIRVVSPRGNRRRGCRAEEARGAAGKV